MKEYSNRQINRSSHWLECLTQHWLLGLSETETAMDACLQIIKANSEKIDGIKISLLSKEAEITMRRQLPEHVRMYTGDDFNYAELIAGDDQGYSDALLGIFDAIAPAASAALAHLAAGNQDRFREIFAPTVPLSRHIFGAPTRFYKTGIVFRLAEWPPNTFHNGWRSRIGQIYFAPCRVIPIGGSSRTIDWSRNGLFQNENLAWNKRVGWCRYCSTLY